MARGLDEWDATLQAFEAASAAELPRADARSVNVVAGYGFNLLPAGQFFGDRVNITDVRFGKILKFGRTRTNVALDLLNLFNTNTTTSFQQN